MAMAGDSTAPPDLHGENHIRKATPVFPGGGKTLAVILATAFLVLLALHPADYFPMPTYISHQMAMTGHGDKACNISNGTGTWVRDFRGPAYTNMTCPTIPDSKNCEKYGKPMDYVNWKWVPHGCDMARFETELFLHIVRGKTLAFAGDSLARNQMESLLCLLSQVEAPSKVHSDTNDKFVTWHFRSHNFTLMALWTKFLVEDSERDINGTASGTHDIHLDKIDPRLAANLHEIDILVISSSQWFIRINYLYEGGKLIGCMFCSEDNITTFSINTGIQRVFRTALNSLRNCQKCRLRLTVVRTTTPTHFENGLWNTGGYCNRTEPVGEGMISEVYREIRNAQLEEVNRSQKQISHKGQMGIEILDVTKAMSMRPDAHPGIHLNNVWMRSYSDCCHWCLPGPIDMWNELLLSVLKKYGKDLQNQ